MPPRRPPKAKAAKPQRRTALSEAETVAAMAAHCQSLAEAMPDIIYFKDRSLHNIVVNDAYAKFVGLAKAAMLGQPDEAFLPATLAAQCRASDEEVLRTGRPLRVEQQGEGDQVFDTLKAPVAAPDGAQVGLIGISRDVTDYKRAHLALRRAEERLRRVVTDAPVVLFQIDKAGRFTLSEGRGLAALGLKPGEVVGRSVFEVYAHNPAILEHVRLALSGQNVSAATEEAGLTYQTNISPQRGADGSVEGLLGVAVDVTEHVRSEREIKRLLAAEKQMRLEAEQANRAKDDFLALISHELRTPMTAMMGWAYLLRQKEAGSPEFNQALEIIERNMHLQAQIIEDLLDVSKIFTGRMRVDQRSLDVSAVLRAAVDVVRPAAQARGVAVDLGSLPAVHVGGDPERLQQVFWNLLSNSLKFTPDGGKVMVRVRRAQGGAEVTVADTGIGIPADYLPHVFDPFSQAERAMTREHRGLGLGLAIVRHIVELHGGAVKAESAGPGCGATFTVRLPVISEAPRPVPAPGSLPAGGLEVLYASLPRLTGIRVLVVEDEADQRRMLGAALKGLGAEVSLAAGSAAGLAAFQKSPPDVLVADLAMPGEDGYSLIRRIRALAPEKGGDVPAAAMTTQTRAEDRTQVLMAGFQMYIPKPVEPAELAAAVKSLASRR